LSHASAFARQRFNRHRLGHAEAIAIVIVPGLISRLLLGFFVNPLLYEMVAEPGDVLQVLRCTGGMLTIGHGNRQRFTYALKHQL